MTMDAIRTVYHPASGGKSARITATMGRSKRTIGGLTDCIECHQFSAERLMWKIQLKGQFHTGRLPDSYVHVFQT